MDNAHSAKGHTSVNMDEIQKLKAENLKQKEDHEKEIKILKLEHKIQLLELERENESLKHEIEIEKVRNNAEEQGSQSKLEKSEQSDDVVGKIVKEMEKQLKEKFNNELCQYKYETNSKLAEHASAIAKLKEQTDLVGSKTETTKQPTFKSTDDVVIWGVKNLIQSHLELSTSYSKWYKRVISSIRDGEVKYFSIGNDKLFLMKKNFERFDFYGRSKNYETLSVTSHKPNQTSNATDEKGEIFADDLDRKVWRRAKFFLLHPEQVEKRLCFKHNQHYSGSWSKTVENTAKEFYYSQKHIVIVLGFQDMEVIEMTN